MHSSDSIFVTGARGLLGQAIVSALRSKGFNNIIAPSSSELDFLKFTDTVACFEKFKPKYVFHTAGAVYGIMGNLNNKGLSYFNNTLINTHVVEACRIANVKKVVGMGSICVYPHPAPTNKPLSEDDVWKGTPHPGEEFYGHAKRGMYAQLKAYSESYGIDYSFIMSTNLYGPGDKFDIFNGHVVPSLVAKFYKAKQVGGNIDVWGDGSSQRDFLYVEDAAEAAIQIMNSISGPVNMATGQMRPISDVVNILAEITGLGNQISWDKSKPKGHDFVGFNIDKLNGIKFKPAHSLEEGLAKTYRWYAENFERARH